MTAETKLCIDLNKIVHERCKDVPHDIGLRLGEVAIQFARQEAIEFANWISRNVWLVSKMQSRSVYGKLYEQFRKERMK